jgi:hypothetical protein
VRLAVRSCIGRGTDQCSALRRAESQRFNQQDHRCRTRSGTSTPLQGRNGRRAQLGALAELFLRQARRQAISPEKLAKALRFARRRAHVAGLCVPVGLTIPRGPT